MARRRNFPGKSREWLEAALNSCLEEKAAGKVINQISTEGMATSSTLTIGIQARIDQLLSDLTLLDPEAYPPGENTPVTVTRAVFRT